MNDTMGKVFYLPNAGEMGPCSRCGDLCRVAAKKNPEARLLRAAEKPEGHCVNCAVAEWFYVTGSREICPDPSSLRAKPVQEQFARVMFSGKSDAKPPEINWEKVIANWNLPFRIGKKKTIDPVAHPYPPPLPRRRKAR